MVRVTGRYERTSFAGEEVAAFVPFPLPPVDPPLELDKETSELLRDAEHGLARLELAGEMVPSPGWFIYGFVRKEAVVSSQIEGTQATLIDLLTFEAAEHSPDDEVEEICNYLEALSYARQQIGSPDGLPLSMRLLNETHRRLMRGVRGAEKQPGEIRRSQNWIGGTRPGNARFVPPPPQALSDLLGAFEGYIHADDNLPRLVRAALLHVQFETIHPYLDGNGRIGRLLVALLLEHWGLLSQPMLYLSLFLKRHRDEYYRLLSGVRNQGDWEAWISFFLEGIVAITGEAIVTARDLAALLSRDRGKTLASPKATATSARLFEALPENPIISIARAMTLLGTSRPTATKAITCLAGAGVLSETTGRQRDRLFSYSAYIEILRTGTDIEAPGHREPAQLVPIC